MIRSTSPRPPAGKYPQLRLYGQPGETPTTRSTNSKMTSALLDIYTPLVRTGCMHKPWLFDRRTIYFLVKRRPGIGFESFQFHRASDFGRMIERAHDPHIG